MRYFLYKLFFTDSYGFLMDMILKSIINTYSMRLWIECSWHLGFDWMSIMNKLDVFDFNILQEYEKTLYNLIVRLENLCQELQKQTSPQ